jgi:hypothetical protein
MKLLGLMVFGALGVLAIGCNSKTTVVSPNQEAPGVNVSGSGSVFGQPDIAVLSLGVSAEADSVGAARTQAADGMNKMLDAVKQNGVDEKDIQTTRFTVQPIYDYTNGKSVLRGFSVDNTVTVKVRKIDDAGKVVDAALAAGGDLSRIDSLQFSIDDPTALEDQAREKAMTDARHKADALAKAGGVELGLPRTISEVAAPSPINFTGAEFAAARDSAASTPIQLGQLEVQVDVQVVYELKD